MTDFNDVFDTARLDDHQLGCVEYVLNSPAYLDVFEPYLRNARNHLNLQLLDRSKERKDTRSDDFLAGGVVAIDGLLSLFKKILEETKMQRIDDSMQRLSPEQKYDQAARNGEHKPILGANEGWSDWVDGPPAYDPATDY